MAPKFGSTGPEWESRAPGVRLEGLVLTAESVTVRFDRPSARWERTAKGGGLAQI